MIEVNRHRIGRLPALSGLSRISKAGFRRATARLPGRRRHFERWDKLASRRKPGPTDPFPGQLKNGSRLSPGSQLEAGGSAPLLFQSADSLVERQQASISALMLRGHRAELLGHRVLGGFQAQQNRRLHGHLVAKLADLGPELALFIEHPLKLSGEKFGADGAVAIGHVATPVVGIVAPARLVY